MTRYLNPTKIEWADFTWNPVVGCRHGCPYCYAAALCKRFASNWGRDPEDPFKPEIYIERLDAPQRHDTPSKIFAVSMGDLFGNWVPVDWIKMVMEAIEDAPRHTFMLLTKNPSKLEFYAKTWGLPDNLWVGTSIEDAQHCDRMEPLSWTDHDKKFVSFEPLLGDVTLSPYFDLAELSWIIVGAQTGPHARMVNEWHLAKIIGEAKKRNIPIFIKDNIVEPLNITPEVWQHFPEGMP